MRLILGILIVLSLLPSKKAYAQADRETLAWIGVFVGLGGVLTLASLTVDYVVTHSQELSEDRKDKYGLIEGGITTQYGRSWAGGIFLDENQLIVGRYSAHLSPSKDVNFKTYELGYRYYWKLMYAEAGLFHARHQQSTTDILSRLGGHEYRFDAYETKGAFGSLGLSVLIWRVTLGVRGTLHRGFATRAAATYENTADTLNRLKKDARDEYTDKRSLYFDVGLAL